MVGGVAIVGYLLYKKYGNKTTTTKGSGTSSFDGGDDFFNASGTKRQRMSSPRGGGSCSAGSSDPACNLCGQSCENGICYYAIYNSEGNVGSYRQGTCGGAGTEFGRRK
tara:strand:+ start:9221 stop:9547 length:327 start_codon:yes stop_codon:yes gene_type:complete